MKATFDFYAALYLRLKVEAARRSRTIRELVAEGVRCVLDAPKARTGRRAAASTTEWVGILHSYARNADGMHDLSAVRASIARRRPSGA